MKNEPLIHCQSGDIEIEFAATVENCMELLQKKKKTKKLKT